MMGLHRLEGSVKQILKSFKIRPCRKLSQNFLTDESVVRKVVAAAEVEESDHVLEIGPGPGFLTKALLGKGAFVIAIEKDARFFAMLQRWRHPRLTLIRQDALQSNLSRILKKKTKVVANIPYHITGRLLRQLLPMGNWITSLTFMMQKEVAQRLSTQKNKRYYSVLTLLANYYSDTTFLFTVEPACFYPQPKVTSAVIQLRLKKVDKQPLPFFDLMRRAFGQRRKMLRVSLRSLYPASQIQAALQDMSLSATARPQELSLEEFWRLGTLLSTKSE